MSTKTVSIFAVVVVGNQRLIFLFEPKKKKRCLNLFKHFYRKNKNTNSHQSHFGDELKRTRNMSKIDEHHNPTKT